MPQIARLAFTFLSLACCCSIARAETFYVNNISGSDQNNGAIADNKGDGVGPLRTINGALKRVQRGDRIVLGNTGAFYEECITLQGPKHSGSSFAPFTIVGNGATLDGTATVPAHEWEHVQGDVFRFAPERAGYQQLFIDGDQAERLPRFDGSYLTSFLKPKQWCLCNGAVQFATEKGKSVHAYDLRYAKHRVGITLYDVENVVIHDLNVRGFQLDGINAHDNAMDCIISQVSSTENGRSGVAVDGASRVRIVRSELRDNGDTQLNLNGWSTTHLHNSKLVDNDAPVWKRHVNNYGRGARLFVDDVPQIETRGWNTEEDQEDDELGEGLDALEASTDTDLIRATDADLEKDAGADPAFDEQEAVLNPLEVEDDAAEEEPVDEMEEDVFPDELDGNEPGDDEPGFGGDDALDEGDLFDDGGAMDDDNPFGED